MCRFNSFSTFKYKDSLTGFVDKYLQEYLYLPPRIQQIDLFTKMKMKMFWISDDSPMLMSYTINKPAWKQTLKVCSRALASIPASNSLCSHNFYNILGLLYDSQITNGY